MAYLKVTHKDKVLFDEVLDDARIYTAGRAKNSDIVMDQKKGISRNHLQIFCEDGQWKLEVLSSLGQVYLEGKEVTQWELAEVAELHLYKYIFVWSPEDSLAQEDADSLSPENIDKTEALTPEGFDSNPFNPYSQLDSDNKNLSHSQEKLEVSDKTDEFTAVSSATLIPRITYTIDGKTKIKELNIFNSVIGRDQSCDVCIDHPKISRRHFEINRVNDEYFVGDLGSANGTQLNGQAVSKNQPVKIESGDQIQISELHFEFEIVDAQYTNKLKLAPPLAGHNSSHLPMASASALPVMAANGLPLPPASSGAILVTDQVQAGNALIRYWKSRKTSFKVLSGVAFILLAVALFMSGASSQKEKPKEGKSELASTRPDFNKLSPEQKSIVKDTFNLAKNHFQSGRHSLCLSELRKLHEIIPYYENSRELENLCKQGVELIKLQEVRLRQEKEKKRISGLIANITKTCKEKIDTIQTQDEMRQCLSQAIEYSPEDPKVSELLSLIQMREARKKEKSEEALLYRKKVSHTKSLYLRAKSLEDRGKLYESIHAYEKFIKKPLVDPEKLKEEAQRNLASVQKKLGEMVDMEFNVCKSAYEKKSYKESILACTKAIHLDPANKDIVEYRKRALSDLRTDMQAIYQDAILDESLGNIESAKEKWSQILKTSLDGEGYYEKSKVKLKKYGIGI